jgi:hypothetical protein
MAGATMEERDCTMAGMMMEERAKHTMGLLSGDKDESKELDGAPLKERAKKNLTSSRNFRLSFNLKLSKQEDMLKQWAFPAKYLVWCMRGWAKILHR